MGENRTLYRVDGSNVLQIMHWLQKTMIIESKSDEKDLFDIYPPPPIQRSNRLEQDLNQIAQIQ